MSYKRITNHKITYDHLKRKMRRRHITSVEREKNYFKSYNNILLRYRKIKITT